MNFPQLQVFANGVEGQNDLSNPQPDQSALLAQNNDLMRQMQQQFAAQQVALPQQQAPGGGFGQFQNLNANVLMSAFQQSGPTGQNPLQGAESLLASVLAAANSGSQNQAGLANSQHSTTPHPGQAGGMAHQQNPFVGFQGLDQLQNMNSGALPQGFQPSLTVNGLQGFQQQLMNLQHQLGAGQGQHGQQAHHHQGGQQDQQVLQQNAFGHHQQQFPWIGQNFNPAAFNPAALSLGALTGGGDQNSFQNQDFSLSNGGMANLGMPGMNPSTFQLQQQFQQVSQQQIGVSQNKGRSSSSNSASPGPSTKGSKLSSLLREEQVSTDRPSGKGGGKKNNALQDKKKRAKSFPEKLMQAMMENADEEAVAWLPDGKSFVIVNPDLFCNDVLNKIFKESKYASFVRKLHRWGFVRLTSGTGTDCFHHPQFQRNKRELASKITCAPRGEKDKDTRSNIKPPSLAGVEKFIRAKVVAAAATASANPDDGLLLKEDDDLSGGAEDDNESV